MGQKLTSALVVEDNSLVNQLFGQMLRDLGFSVTCVATLGDARRALTRQAYDFLLTDLNLHHEPGGLALAHETIRDCRGTRVVLTSGHPAPETMPSEVAFLPKPFTMAQLSKAAGR